ncbi:hypothetical protein K8Z49_14190 [Actinomadura madurae]|uniref:Uncharacterized protein n=1 Tax=Actinomadura madurae TaxID=1993 RepID=A0A1I5VR60_9ACTN|nr:hypothetical protein [Actinomadura madurae]SFQ09989.1 hypothetical protein SAMN04489713_12217 [Actinomadura madurae]SPT49609.1 Uncharacterised protein [Actinomadura madurae]
MNDDELMAQVRDAFEILDPVPADVLAAARASIAWRTPSAALAELALDRGGRAAAGVRGGAGRTLTFACPDRTVEIEVTRDGRHREITGRLVPPAAALVQVRHRDLTAGALTARAEPGGLFCLPRVPSGLVSLVFRLDGGASVVTSWVRL